MKRKKQNPKREAEKIFWYFFIGLITAIISTFAIGQIREIFPETKEILGLPFPLDTFFIIMFSIFLTLVLYLLRIDKKSKLR